MTGGDAPFAPVSGGPLDGAGPDPASGLEPGARYELGGLLGRGGMGNVHVARDPRLGRDVAVKKARAPADGARLAREAAMTARLEHPGIMPVYDAGTDEDGLPFYTMRMLPGRSLADVLATTAVGPERLRLVRHLLDAAQAIAYAHGRGVLHRDVKPANVMVGAFGETVVADWGLACTVEDAAAGLAAGAGTPGYMSPEQAAGDPVDERADVYGLGASLYELLVGTPPPAGAAAPPVRSRAPDAPPALAAIADRALRAAPAARYPTARAFADDLLAWYEGRRVSAHAYTAGELIALLVAAWRVPLVVGATGALALSVAVGVGWWRTAVEQGRARTSEARAVEAQRAEEAALGRALVAQARSAASAGAALDAEVLAANALSRVESPEARGVLARFARSPRLALDHAGPALPACRTRALARDGARLLCITGADARLLHPGTGEERARTDGAWLHGALADADRALLSDEHGVAWIWAPPAAPRRVAGLELPRPSFGPSEVPGRVVAAQGSDDLVVDLGTGAVDQARSCGTDRVSAVAALAADGSRFVGCADRRVLRVPPGGIARALATLTPEEGPPLGLEPCGDQVLVATARGWVVLFGPDGARVAARRFGADTARAVRAGRGEVAVLGQDGALSIWWPERDALLPPLHAPGGALAWLPGGRLRVVGARAEDRRVPAGPDRHRAELEAGVAGVAFDPTGARVAVGLGNGAVEVLAADTLTRVARWRWQDDVAKDVAWSPDGRLVAVAAASADQRVVDLATGEAAATFPMTARRVAWTVAGLFYAGYRDEVRWWRATDLADGEELIARQIVDLELDGARGSAIDREGGVYRVDDGGRPVFVRLTTQPRAIAVGRVGDDVLVADRARLVRYGVDGAVLEERATPRGVAELAVSPDEALLAIGYLDGTTSLWRPGAAAPLAVLEGHAGRVSALAFAPDGRTLATGGWDETVRLWSLAELEAPAAALVAAVEAAWGRDLDAILGSPR